MSVIRTTWRYLYWNSSAVRRAHALAYSAAWRIKLHTPVSFAKPRTDLSGALTIGITTYLIRYDSSFRSLLTQLSRLFPELRIIVAVNGFYDVERQLTYLNRIRKDWSTSKNIQFLLHRSPQGLARLWNEIIEMTPTNHVLMLNDDVEISPRFRPWIESRKWQAKRFVKIKHHGKLNHGWSHFFISKGCYREIGPFDEAFTGISYEDIDYEARMLFAGNSIAELRCPYLRHLAHVPKETSYGPEDATWNAKYSVRNRERFFSKWERCEHSPPKGCVFVSPPGIWVRPNAEHRSSPASKSKLLRCNASQDVFLEFD